MAPNLIVSLELQMLSLVLVKSDSALEPEPGEITDLTMTRHRRALRVLSSRYVVQDGRAPLCVLTF